MLDPNQKYCNEENHAIDAPEKDYLYLKTSQILGAGKGLFTAIPIYKDEIISIFKGELLSNAEAKRRAKASENGYFIMMPNGGIMDSKNIKCFAKYANDTLGMVRTRFKNNAKISLNEHDEVCLVAIKKINAGEEIFCAYGAAYWKSSQ